MGIYLGQLPPAEVARLKAELAETLIANFCYPRFFDARTQSLRMRPVDRAKRQEVWLYLSAVDFTQWSRIDLMSPEFQHQVERLFIQFVQRNRSFFGEQGRRRMSDIRMLLSTSAGAVAQGLRNHIMGKQQGNSTFGSPRPSVSWSAMRAGAKAEPSWEQVAAATMLLQQQLQELRGEIKASASPDGRPSSTASRRPALPSSPAPLPQGNISGTVTMPGARNGAAARPPEPPNATPNRRSGPLVARIEPSTVSMPAQGRPAEPAGPPAQIRARKSELLSATGEASAVAPLPAKPGVASGTNGQTRSAREVGTAPGTPAAGAPLPQRNLPAAQPPVPTTGMTPGQREASMMRVGEDDLAIFEQMRHQLLLWLRIEAVSAGIDISGLSPSQLLEQLSQNSGLDETRLQVVSTLLNLSNQVIKTGLVSILDYKQALLFHLMHTKR
jgi:hypothetical protein